jgi:hypothetical protein
MKTYFLFAALCLALCLTGCDAAEEILDGEEAALKEADLPNCSKVINCCANLKTKDLSDDINEACDEQFVPSANRVIDTYQSAKGEVTPGSEAEKALYDETRGSVEIGCRCFLEQSVGQIDAVLLPLDCEADTSVGQAEADMCDGAVDNLVNPTGDQE